MKPPRCMKLRTVFIRLGNQRELHKEENTSVRAGWAHWSSSVWGRFVGLSE